MENTLFTGDRYEALKECYDAAASYLKVNKDILFQHPDFFLAKGEEGRNFIGVEVAHNIVRRSFLMPVMADKTVVVIDGMDSMTIEAQNVLLKTLEDCNHYVVILGASTNDSSVLETVKSRLHIKNCMKLSKQDFMHCTNDNTDLRYLVSNGYPERAKRLDNYIDMFENLRQGIKLGKPTQILDSVGLLNENEKTPFEKDKELYMALFCFLQNYFADELYKAMSEGNSQRIQRAADVIKLSKSEAARWSVNYSKNDLFHFIVTALL